MAEITQSRVAEPDWAAFVGLDWGDEKHHWKLLDAQTQQYNQGVLLSTPEPVGEWAAGLATRFDGRPIAVGLEQSRGALLYQLSQYGHLVLYPVPPTMSARFRGALHPSGSKSDPDDSGDLLDLVVHHRDRLRRLDPDTPETRLLQMLVEQRRQIVQEKTRWSNRLTACLKLYFPQVLEWIDDIDSPLGCALLQNWPTLEALQRCHPGTLHKFFVAHHSRCEKRIQERIQAVYAAQPAIRDTAELQAAPLQAQQIVTLLGVLHEHIRQLERHIAELVAQHPEREWLAALPGAGPALLPRLLVAFGTQRERYRHAGQMQAYSGVAPVREQSGRSQWVHFRRSCPKFLRQTFHEFAACSRAKSAWAKAYYDMQRARGKGHQAAVRALAFKWIRVLFACWQNRTPYDEQIYMRSREQRAAQLPALLGPATQLGWKEVNGFQKISLQKT